MNTEDTAAGQRSLRADARRNRDRLLQVAEELFAVHGAATPIDQVARAAKVGMGTVYRHFPTKEALFEAIAVSRVRQLIDDARAIANAYEPGEGFFSFCDLLVEQSSVNKGLYDALNGAGMDVQESFTALGGELMEALGELLARAQRAGAVRDDVTAADVKALLAGLHTAEREGGSPDRLMAVIRSGLRPPTAT